MIYIELVCWALLVLVVVNWACDLVNWALALKIASLKRRIAQRNKV